jgi:hypothetical protein
MQAVGHPGATLVFLLVVTLLGALAVDAVGHLAGALLSP